MAYLAAVSSSTSPIFIRTKGNVPPVSEAMYLKVISQLAYYEPVMELFCFFYDCNIK